MRRRDIGTDDIRVKVRPGKGSRPRTKIRPTFANAVAAFVTEVDRGRFTAVTKNGTVVQAVKARALGRKGVIVGDRVGLEGDVSGDPDSLARIVTLTERETVLRRSIDESETGSREKLMVANATQLLVVVAAAEPAPKRGMIDRALAAAIAAGVKPVLVVTKTDLDSATDLKTDYLRIGVPVYTAAVTAVKPGVSSDELAPLLNILKDQVTVLLGHSGVGKSTLINALVPGASRATGRVNVVTGKGRHTSSSAIALPVAGGGWVIDTPGVRSFGLAHLDAAQLLAGFPELETIAAQCPRGCHHLDGSPDCLLDTRSELRERVASYRNLVSESPKAY